MVKGEVVTTKKGKEYPVLLLLGTDASGCLRKKFNIILKFLDD